MSVADNLSNSCIQAVRRARKFCGVQFPFEQIDLKDYEATDKLFDRYQIDAIIHFAGRKAVESYPMNLRPAVPVTCLPFGPIPPLPRSS